MPVETQKFSPTAPKKMEEHDPVYLKIRDVVYQACGIYHSEEKLYLLSGACKRRMPNTKASDARQYLELLGAPATRPVEMRELLNEITIGETCLFRSPPQLAALQNVVLPELIAARSKIGLRKLKIWSAGCSTGEEPYTLSMFLLEQSEKLLRGWAFEITATDLNDRSIETAKAGIYGDYALRNTSEHFKRKYFKSVEGEKLQVREEVKAPITFSRLNLSDDSKMLFVKSMDLIFCCNVLIYFDVASKRRVISHFYSGLQAPGYFFMGPAESLYQVSDQFRLVHLPGTTTYVKALPGSTGASVAGASKS
ncbi:MAG TPA: protein-glutamate O-methyltransferase CheR [Candidatus Acidoferrum sp.]|nr:protein-glutamate O-methyltransferase CheR [Candidatus Acidoferrum sp.]